MKQIKFLEQQKDELVSEERRICQVTYQTDKDKMNYIYSFTETRNAISRFDSQIRKLKHSLNYSNATTIVESFDMTLGECLIYMAQLNNEKMILESLYGREAYSRRSTLNGVVEYTELNYDKAECKERLVSVQDTISRLQIAIDRTNLTNAIEI